MAGKRKKKKKTLTAAQKFARGLSGTSARARKLRAEERKKQAKKKRKKRGS